MNIDDELNERAMSRREMEIICLQSELDRVALELEKANAEISILRSIRKRLSEENQRLAKKIAELSDS